MLIQSEECNEAASRAESRGFGNHQAEIAFSLENDIFVKNVKCARRGAAAGPPDMTSEHLKPILENARDSDLLFQVTQLFSHKAPEALPSGTIGCNNSSGQQLIGLPAFQHALSTRAGTECIAHAIQALTDLDGIGA